MIYRLSSKLAAQLKVTPLQVLPLNVDPLLDWSAHLFIAGRTQFIIVTNTASLYSTVFPARGISCSDQFVDQAKRSLSELMIADGLAEIHDRYLAAASNHALFAKAYNRSVTGSMNDLIVNARIWLTEGQLTPNATALQLNEIPFSALDYRNPQEVFTSLFT